MIHDKDVESLATWRPEAVFAEIHPKMSSPEALLESDRCLQCGGPGQPAPCITACPSDVDVPKFIWEILHGDAAQAGETIFAANALGGTCARVCPVDELCEGACVLHREGRRPVEIGRLQRFATDAALESGAVPAPRRLAGPSVAIVGAGPAGLACARALAEQGRAATVYEKRPLAGGLVSHAIAPYKQVVDPIPGEVARIAALGVEVVHGVEVGKDVSVEELKAKHAAVFLGAGLGADTPAALPGEDLEGVLESLEFIERIKLGEGVRLGRRVAVIGGGNTALDVVREAVRLGAEEVTLVYRRDEEQMPAYRHEVASARAEGVRFQFLTAPVRILGEGRVSGLECRRMELGEPDASGRPRPVAIEGSEFVLEVDSVVTAIGQQPLAGLFEAFGVATQKGNVTVDAGMATSVPGVFAGGDCITGGATVVEAVRDGKVAAASIQRFLGGADQPAAAVVPMQTVRDGLVTKHFQGGYHIGLSPTLCKGCGLCIYSCPSEILLLDSHHKIELTEIDKCVFCGICETRCPDFAIWVSKGHREHPVETEAQRRLAR